MYKCTVVGISKFPYYGCPLAGVTGSKPAVVVDVFVVCVLFVVQVEASATGRSFIQGSPTECVCAHVCD